MPKGESQPEKNLHKIGMQYVKSDFIIDFILWFPSQRILHFLENKDFRIILLIKAWRIKQSMQLLNVHKIMSNIKHYLQTKSE
jgi:hypothetical protein